MSRTDETLLIFTDHGNCYPLAVNSLNECKPKDRGQLLSGVLVGLEDGEKALWISCLRMVDIGHMPDYLFVTRQGMIKRSAAVDYDVRSKKFAAVNLKKDDALMAVIPAATRDDILMLSRSGMCIRFALDTIPTQGRVSAGVKCMQVDDSDEVIWVGQIDENEQMVLFTERGYAKRLMSMDFERQNRNGKGVKSFYFNKNGSNGRYLAGIVKVDKGPCDLIISQMKSPPTRLNKDSILLQGKQDRGNPCVMAILDDVVTGVVAVDTAE